MKDKPNNSLGNELPRRRFIDLLGWGGFYGLISVTLVNTLRFFVPAALEEPSSLVKLGSADFLTPGDIYIDEKKKVILNRTEDGSYYAQSAICTHLGCIVRLKKEENMFACPCHGSKFKLDGTRIEGPAPRDLNRLSVILDFDGKLLVDKALKVGRDYKLKV
ncbi:Rieske (2Fe-2S) protein [bacterium]|nr:Rieske (2Fe-2S) protein [bacterium]